MDIKEKVQPHLKMRLHLELLLHSKTLVETINTTAGINQFLFAGEERMTF